MTNNVNKIKAALLAGPFVFAASVASAGGLSQPVETVAPTPIAPAPVMMMRSDWTGFYAGGQLGFGELTSPLLGRHDGYIAGVHAGYMYDLGTIVLGAELDYDLSGVEFDNPTFGGQTNKVEIDSTMRLKARVGYDAGSFLPYITGGVVRSQISDTGPFGQGDLEADGDFYGAGVAYKFNDNLIIGGEVLQHKFYEGDISNDNQMFDLNLRATTATARVSYQF